MPEKDSEQFDFNAYLDQLIEEMGLKDMDAMQVAQLKEQMSETLRHDIFTAAEENMEPEVIDAVMEELADETDPAYILRELILASPGAQIAMLEAIDNFRKNTLEAFNKLKS